MRNYWENFATAFLLKLAFSDAPRMLKSARWYQLRPTLLENLPPRKLTCLYLG
ncbi:MAG: hypothetical protein ACFFD8_04260 [Candidatus Thorarchaeota archaeon]